MKSNYLRIATLLAALALGGSGQRVLGAVIKQQPGTDYLIVEAEAFDNDDLNNPATGWIVIDPTDPQEVPLHNSNPGTIMVPPPSSNPSGGLALFDLEGGGDFTDQIGYALQFETPGAYYLYMRYSMFDLRNHLDNTYGNEDSVYLPVETIDQDPAEQILRDSRDGFVGLSQAIDGVTIRPFDGCRIPEEPWVLSDAECDAEGARGPAQFEGQYHWQAAQWNNDLGQVNYAVEQTGIVLDFSIATRERGSSLDVLIFSQNPDLTSEDLDALLAGGPAADPGDYDADGDLDDADIDALSQAVRNNATDNKYDLNQDGNVSAADRTQWVESLKNTYFGDSNLDGEFSSSDFVQVFQRGEYEDAIAGNSGWADGDWDGNQDFDSGDFVFAFQSGAYEQGPRAAVASVPEPGTAALLLIGVIAGMRRRQP